MNNGNFFNMIIPLVIFLVLLALGQVFNREQNAAQQRARTGSPLGPRPGSGANSWSVASGPRDPFAERRSGDDGIVILSRDTEDPRVFATEVNLQTVGDRRPKRKGRSGPQKRLEKPTPSPTPPGMLGSNDMAAASRLIDTGPTVVTNVASPGFVATQATIQGVLAAISDPKRLQEAVVLNAILKPPIGLNRLLRLRNTPPSREISS
jgi:hypothetical protein